MCIRDRIEADGVVVVKVKNEEAMIRSAVEQFNSGDEPETKQHIMETSRDVCEGRLREIIADMTAEQLYRDRKTFSERVQEVAAQQLSELGLELKSFTIKGIGDQMCIRDRGYMEQMPEFAPGFTLLDAVLEMFNDIFALRDRLRKLEVEMGTVEGQQLEQLLEEYSQLTHNYESLGGFSCESRAKGIIKGLGFSEDDFGREIACFSGGEKTRASLAVSYTHLQSPFWDW